MNDVFEQGQYLDYLIRRDRFSYLGNRLPVKLARQLSARNRLKGTITSIKKGGVVAGVEVKLDGTGDIVYSVITLEAVSELKLKVGDKVAAIIRATEVMISKG